MRTLRTPRGTTLIEAMIATVILAVGVAGVAAAMIATAGQDRRNSARSAAITVAEDLSIALSRLPWNDARLVPGIYSPTNYTTPRLLGATQVLGPPPAATDNWAPGDAPTYGEGNLGAGLGVRTLAELNSVLPGRTLVMNRYWNVIVDPTNVNLKLIAVHVTYNAGKRQRLYATVHTSVLNEAALANAFAF